MKLPPFSRSIIASVLAIVALWTGVVFGDTIILQFTEFRPEKDGTLFLLLSKAVQTAIVLLAFALFFILCKDFPKPHPDRKQFWIIGLPIIWLIANGVQVAYPKLPDFPIGTVTIGAALLVGISEEIVFRYIFHRTLAGFSTGIYILISSAVFGMLHYSGYGYLSVVITMFVGATFDLARVKGAPMWLLILFHAAIDFILLLPHKPIEENGLMIDIAMLISIGVWLFYVGNPKNWRRPGTSTGLHTEQTIPE